MAKQPKFKLFPNKKLGCYEVNLPAAYNGGKRGRRRFKDRAEGLEFCRGLKEQRNTFGKEFSDLTRTRQIESVEAYRRLDTLERPYSLLSIVDEWMSGKTNKTVLSAL